MARTRLLFACLALAAPIVPATAQAVPLPASGLVLSVRPEMGTLSTTVLTCEPAGGPHKNAKQACADLIPVDGDFTRMEPAADAACTMELNTTKAKLRGKWRGKKVVFEQEYSNPCVMRVHTGKVFDF
ncbi:subtilisin inhibitor-like [Lentzea atacamensis]|uniref:Subtilisin inhibitor-like n=1 Tax=Lentzea atacamensis TaxID=531938 RepID=A0A316HVZ6_9PSEU|nr:SSI family serine proteinase inhibitor [Lentzea atacamensis]PWK84293.1 subtilisin inhibitor-like [Lentzea atacamensis]